MTVKAHYDNHLAHFYAWMTGDFQTRYEEFKSFLIENAIKPSGGKIAIDLGAGHGIQSIPLAAIGFNVLAVYFNQQLLNALVSNAQELNVTAINADIKNVATLADRADLVVCCGDTLSHLADKNAVKKFITDVANTLDERGIFILSFRDYTHALTGIERFIPVKSDDSKIFTCMLEYEDEYVQVTDLLYERTADGWKQKVSSYQKVRLCTHEVVEQLQSSGLNIRLNKAINRMTTIIAVKG